MCTIYKYFSSSHYLQCATKNYNYNYTYNYIIPTCVANIRSWKATPKENHLFVRVYLSVCHSHINETLRRKKKMNEKKKSVLFPDIAYSNLNFVVFLITSEFIWTMKRS